MLKPHDLVNEILKICPITRLDVTPGSKPLRIDFGPDVTDEQKAAAWKKGEEFNWNAADHARKYRARRRAQRELEKAQEAPDAITYDKPTGAASPESPVESPPPKPPEPPEPQDDERSKTNT